MATLVPNKERLRMWVRALRSGQYEQGKGELRTADNKYCCLGVALDLALGNGVKVNEDLFWGQTGALPDKVTDWYGDHLNSSFSDFRCPSSLNDEGVSFAKIADRIESKYELKEN